MAGSIAVQDRYRGALLGLAVGDALGAQVEFMPPGSFVPVNSMRGGGPHGLKPGQWTDDTSMALCLAESLLQRGGTDDFDPCDQMQRYWRWYQDGYWSSTGDCFDIGLTTREALEAFHAHGEPFSGPTNPRQAGNGSIMRLAPVPMRYAGDPAAALHWAAESSRTTHGARTCIDGCRYLAGLIVGALQGVDKTELLRPGYCPVAHGWAATPLCPEIAAVAAGSFKSKKPPALRGSGYVVESLEAALWAFFECSSFKEGCLLAVNLGDDADTTGAVFGQLAGAYYGAAGDAGSIPTGWLYALALRDPITAMADGLLAASRPRG